MESPHDYKLPLEEWRPFQLESIKWAENIETNIAKIGEFPTGSGKSAQAIAMSKDHNIVILTKTKALQTQYANGGYNAAILFGKANYSCTHALLPVTATADDCKFQKGMEKCHIASKGYCEYFNARELAKLNDRVVFNYALWFTTHKNWHPGYLILDEAHNVSEMVLNHVGFELSERTRRNYEFPELPTISEATSFVGHNHKPLDNLDSMLHWLEEMRILLNKRIGRLDSDKKLSDKDCTNLRIWRNYYRKVDIMQEVLEKANLDHWFIRSGMRGQNGQPGMMCRPITARYNTKDYFDVPRILYMSATIGDVTAFAQELGIEKYDYRVVDSVWPVEKRPVYVLPCPSMGKTATEKDPAAFEKQADEIANAILSCPKDWSGFVLVTRKSESILLSDRLARRGLQDRVWVTPGYDGEYSPTDSQIQAWEDRKKEKPNSICISWAFWEGVNGVEEKICIIAKAPYVAESDYERARRSFDGRFYLQRAAYILEQGLGRTRRGNTEDYDEPDSDIQRGLVCIADASWKKLRPYMSQAIRNAIVEV